MLSRLICLSLALWRAGIGVLLVIHAGSNAVALLYGEWEVVASVIAAVNALSAEIPIRRWWTWVLPVLYCLGFIAFPVGTAAPMWLVWAMLAVWIVRAWALVVLGRGYSVGVATWWQLAESGPYSVIRHPMQMTGLAARLVFCLANPLGWNWFGLTLMLCASVGIVLLEECTCRQYGPWREYAARVRWRLLPGVW